MWKARLVRKERNGSRLGIVVTYSDGKSQFDEIIMVTNSQRSDYVARFIYDRIQQLLDLDTYEQSIELGDVLPVSTTPPTLTPSEQARLDYMKKLNDFKHFVSAVNLGLIDATLPAYNNLKTYLRTNFDPSYIDLFS